MVEGSRAETEGSKARVRDESSSSSPRSPAQPAHSMHTALGATLEWATRRDVAAAETMGCTEENRTGEEEEKKKKKRERKREEGISFVVS